MLFQVIDGGTVHSSCLPVVLENFYLLVGEMVFIELASSHILSVIGSH